MTQEDKALLLKDLCARLPYGVKINIRNDYTFTMEDVEFNAYHLTAASYNFEYRGLRPYLRPMSSMTEEEWEEACSINEVTHLDDGTEVPCMAYIDWLLSNHFDFRGLIPMGLALEAPVDMYKTK